MSTQESHNEGPSYRSVEVGVALAVMAFGAIVIAGSISAGIRWGAEGPKAGFFPFYIGIAIIISGAINLWNGIKPDSQGGLFAEWGQLRQVLSVVIPTAIYVASMPFIGLYVASWSSSAGSCAGSENIAGPWLLPSRSAYRCSPTSSSKDIFWSRCQRGRSKTGLTSNRSRAALDLVQGL